MVEEDVSSDIPPTTLIVPATYSSFDTTETLFAVLIYIIGNTGEVSSGTSGDETSLSWLHEKNVMTIKKHQYKQMFFFS